MIVTCALATVAGPGWANDPMQMPSDPPAADPAAGPDAPAMTSPSYDPSLDASDLAAPGSMNAMATSVALNVPTTIAAGRTPGAFGVTNSGAATYTIPIWTPPGVGSVEAKLALTYSSRTGNGVLGQGWALGGLSAITRCNRTWAQDGTPGGVTNTLADRFCLDGQQLKLVSGTYGTAGSVYATEIESFSRIVAAGTVGNGPASFTVTTKNGLIYDYGLTGNAQIMAGTSGTVRTWAVSKIRDRINNRITVTYANDSTNGTYRVTQIDYPTTATAQGPFYSVVFSYGARPTNDIPSGYLGGFLSKEVNQLNSITIQTYGSAALIKGYYFGYNQGTATNRLRLASIQECSATSCLRATQINYQDSTKGWSVLSNLGVATAAPNRVIPIDLNGDGITDIVYPIAGGSGYNWNVLYGTPLGTYGTVQSTGVTTTTAASLIAGDVNSDGRTDILFASGGVWNVLSYNGTALTQAATSATPSGSCNSIADVDGDGKPDLVFGSGNQLKIARNTTTAGTVSFAAASVGWTIPINWGGSPGINSFVLCGAASGPSPMVSADFNGDGRNDLVARIQTTYPGIPPTTVYSAVALISQGTTFAQGPSPVGTGSMYLDWNGDGCTDFVSFPTTGNSQVNISNCAGGFATPFSSGLPGQATALAADWDGDGRMDLLTKQGSTWYVARSTGTGVATPVNTGISPASGAWFTLDGNGDGLTDLGYADQANGNRFSVMVHNGPGLAPDLATSFTDGFGINQSPAYVSMARSNYTRYSDATFPEADYQGALYVVNQFTASDGTGSTYQNQFDYYGARVHLQGRGFEGFYKQRVKDTRNNLYVDDFVERPFPYTGIHTKRSVLQEDLTPIREWSAEVNKNELGNAGYDQRVFPFLSTVADARYELGGSLNGTRVSQSTMSYTYGDGYGNPTQILSSVTDKDPNSPFLDLVWQSTVNTTFSNDSGSNCLGLPTLTTRTETAAGQSAQTRTAAYTVDTSTCRNTQQVLEPSTPALKVTTTLGFDSCGNVNSLQVIGATPGGTAMPARTTTFGYGTRCQLPEAVTNALGQATSIAYSYDFGVPTQSTDPNGLATAWQYDDFGRRTLETRPDQTTTSWAFESCATGPCWSGGDFRFHVYETSRGSVNDTYQQRELFYDGLERLRSDQRYRVLGVWTTETVLYDSLGRPITQYRPSSSGSNGYVTWTYDALDRVTSQKLYQPSGTLDRTTTLGHAGRTTTITDPLGHARTQVQDVLGRLRRVTDPYPGGTTSYEYDSFGNLNRIQDAIGAISTGTYNLRGFRTQWADADRGTWTFAGNSLNELVSWSDAKGQSFSAIYDALGRMTSRTEPEGTSSWTWGTSAASHNIGQLQSVAGYGYAESLAYDNVSRPVTRTITTDQAYQYDYTYNSIGAIDTVLYPTSPIPAGQSGARFKVQYAYSYGAPNQISDITEAAARNLWILNTANDYSSPATETVGPNLLTVTSGYTTWTNELTTRQAGATPSTSNRQNLAYQWDTAGNLTQRQDGNQSLTEAFTLDALDRVTSSTLNGVNNLTVGYDAAGNITSKTDVGSYTYGNSAHPHAVMSAGTRTFTYDANGNQLTRDGATQTWASFNLPTLVAQPIAGTTYQSQFNYGPDHQRWKQIAGYVNGTETTYYVGGLLEKEIATSTGGTYWRHYVPLPSGMSVVVSRNADHTSTTTYVLTDHLGSSDALLDEAGNYRTRESFSAFGARRGSDWSSGTAPDWLGIANNTRHGFTGHEHIDNTGLIHMNGRTYDPLVGRFMSVDPIIGDPSDSQSVNPYAYVGNRPLSFTDPSGFSAADGGGGDGGNGGGFGGPQHNDGSPGTWRWWGRMFESIGHFFGLGSDPPPPPPAIALPGQSAQNGVGMCGPGNTSVQCSGWLMSMSGPGGVEIQDPMTDPAAPPDLGDLFSSWYWGDNVAPETRKTIAASVMTVGGMGALCIFGAEPICAGVLIATCVQGAADGMPCDLRIGGAARAGARPPSMSPAGAGRQGALNEAKRANGVPTSQQPSRTLPNTDKRGNPQPGRIYEYEVPAEGGGTRTVRIRDDAGGSDFGAGDPQNRGPHFNDDAKRHYDYPR